MGKLRHWVKEVGIRKWVYRASHGRDRMYRARGGVEAWMESSFCCLPVT